MKIQELLGQNPYPGRGILLGKNLEGRILLSYFIMGRSENSRNRVFVRTDADTVETRAFDESRMIDPSLIIYAPFRHLQGGTFIISNGDQTDTIRDYLEGGRSFADALRTRTFEPDAPNYTPRISGLIEVLGNQVRFRLSMIKSGDPEGREVRRMFYEYENVQNGVGKLIHTYEGDGNPLPSFMGEPRNVEVAGGLEDWHGAVWSCLNRDNRISLMTVQIEPDDGSWDIRLTNQNGE